MRSSSKEMSIEDFQNYIAKEFPNPKVRKSIREALKRAIQGSFANCNISVDLDLFNGGIIGYI